MNITQKHTAELVDGDVVAVRYRPAMVDQVALEVRYNRFSQPVPSNSRWLTVEQVIGCAGWARVDFTNGGVALAPFRNCAWYVRVPEIPS